MVRFTASLIPAGADTAISEGSPDIHDGDMEWVWNPQSKLSWIVCGGEYQVNVDLVERHESF